MPPNGQRLTAAIARFDALNRDDPNTEVQAGQSIPSQLLYAQRMTSTLERFAPDAPPAVRLAARAQHICRWKIPRESYPPGRDGYRRWRSDLGRFHAETAGSVLKEVGYDAPMIDHVAALLRKERLKADADCQLLEDVICLVKAHPSSTEIPLRQFQYSGQSLRA